MNIVKKFPEEMDARTQYKLMKSPDIKRMVDAEDSILDVKSWIMYTDDADGKEKALLSIETTDGEIFVTMSKIFSEEFKAITEVFGDDIGEIKVVSGWSKAGRKFITCTVY